VAPIGELFGETIEDVRGIAGAGEHDQRAALAAPIERF
jgi:hypothetical protein